MVADEFADTVCLGHNQRVKRIDVRKSSQPYRKRRVPLRVTYEPSGGAPGTSEVRDKAVEIGRDVCFLTLIHRREGLASTGIPSQGTKSLRDNFLRRAARVEGGNQR